MRSARAAAAPMRACVNGNPDMFVSDPALPFDSSCVACLSVRGLEATVSHGANDGVGFVFGWQDSDDYYQAVMINDQWPNPPADGVGGPMMKLKYRNPAVAE